MEKFSYKTLFTIVVILLIGIVVLIRIQTKPTTVEAAWYHTGWTNRLMLTIDHTKVSADQTDFPILVSLASLPADFHAHVNQTDARDIRVTKSDGTTELPREVVYYDSATDAGELYFKYTGTLSSTVDTSIYIYYGNSGATDYDAAFEFGKNNVWDSNYVGVWHLNEVGTTRYDSTSNNNHLAISGTVSNATGKIGTAASFTQAGNLFRSDTNLSSNFPSKNGQTVTDLSASFWVKATSLGWHDWLGKENGTGWYFYDNTTSMGISYINGSEYGTFGGAGSVTTGTWYNITGVHNSTTDTDYMYINGAVGGTEVSRTVDPGSSSASFMLGGTTSWPTDANGLVDEVRVSKSVRSATWVSTEHNNQNSPSTFFSATVPTENNNTEPVAYWKFNENVGTSVYDSSPNRFDGIIETGGTSTTLPSWTIGKYDSALQFDGLGNRFTKSGDNSILRPSANMSVEAWVYLHALPSEVPGGREVIIMKKHGGSPWESYELQADYTSSENRFTFAWVNASGTGYNAFTRPTTFTMAKNTWYHVVGVRNGSSLKIYVNGSNLTGGSNLPTGGDTLYASNSDLQIGSDGNTAAFKGVIDEVKLYDYARTDSQIKNSYNADSGVKVGRDLNDTLSNGLVGWWKMDENTGTTVIDSSGGTNTVTFAAGSSAPEWSTLSKFGVGLSLNGTTDYATAADSNSLDVTTNFTISAWVESNDLSAGEEYIISKDGSGDTTNAYNFYLQAGGRVCYETNNQAASVCSSSNSVAANAWYHVAVVFDDSATNKVAFYVNGVKTGYFNSNTTQAPTALTTSLLIGRRGNSGSEFSGLLDDIRLYNRSLSSSEMQILYKYAPGPIGQWKMEEASWNNNCSTGTVLDSSGNSRNLKSCPNSTGPVGNGVGKNGKAGTFDGSDDYLESTNSVFNLTDQITISAWVRPLTEPSGDAFIVDKTNNNLGYSFGLHSPPEPRLRIGNSSSYTTITSSTNLTMGTWYYLTAVVGADRTAKIYINGNYDTGATNVTLFGSTQNFHIGGRSAAGTFLNANIDDVKIYNYPRTQSQIMEDMGSGKPLTPVVNLKFEENSGTLANDSSGNGFNGTLASGTSSPAWTLGRSGQALSFDGNDYVQIPDNNSLDFTGDFTLSAWVSRSGGVNEYTISKTDASSDGGYALLIGNLGEVYCRTAHGSGYDDSYTATGYILADSSWHHIAAARTGSSCRVYVDGVDRTNTADVHTTLTANAKNLRIGTQPAGGNYTNGKIDEVNIYNYSLNADEIKQLYNRNSVIQSGQTVQTIGATTTSLKYCIPGDTASCNAPIGEWNFDTNVGTPSTLPDTSGNGNNGVANGSMTSDDWVPGKNGSALNFDGTNDYINIYSTNLASLFSGNSGTVTAWFRVGDGVWGDGVQHQVLTIGADVNNMITIRKASDGSLNTLYTAAATNETSLDCALTDTGYIFVAMSWDQTAGKVVHYCNGLITDTDTALGTYTGALSSTRATIGAHTTGATYPWKGDIDDLRIYNYVRTPAQVGLDYNQGGPLVWYKFDECQGSIIHNSMGTGYTGVISIGAAGTQTSLGTCNSGTAAAWTNGASGKISGSLNFDGNDDLAAVTEADTKGSLDIGSSDSFSVAYWFNPTSLPGASTYDTYAGKNNGGNGWYTQIYSDGSLEFCVVNTSVHCYSGNQNVVNVGSWNHYAVAYTSGDDSSIRLYHNGKLLTGSWGGTANLTVPNTNNNLTFGSNGDGTEEATGKIDDFRYYGYLLTETQIKTIMNNGSATFR